MKALYVKKPFQFDLRDEEPQEPAPDEVQIAVRAAGVCGTDLLHARTAADWSPVGHEAAGEIVALGDWVSDFKVGQSVVFENSTYCGFCGPCKDNRTEACEHFYGYKRRRKQSAFADLITVPAKSVIPCEGLDWDAAALAEPLTVALALVKSAEIALGRATVVVGLGPIGLMCLRLAAAAGARPIWGIDQSGSDVRVDLARRWGATDVLLSDKDDCVKTVMDAGGADSIIHTAPPSTLPEATAMCAKDATLAFCGIQKREPTPVPLDANLLHFRRLQVRGVYPVPNWGFPTAVRLLKEGVVPADDIVSHRFALAEAATAFRTLVDDRAHALKVILHP